MDPKGWNQVRKAIRIVKFIEDNRSLVTAKELVDTLNRADLDGVWGALAAQAGETTRPSDEVKELIGLLADLTTHVQTRTLETREST